MADKPQAGPAKGADTITRPYRSKKQRPCDGCRRRRVGCFVPAGQKDCVLCHHRGTSCTFESAAPVKKGRPTNPQIPRRRQPAGRSQPQPQTKTGAANGARGASPGDGRSGAPSPHLKVGDRQGAVDEDVRGPIRTTMVPGRTALYVGSSSDQDVYLLRHLPFDEANSFGHPTWKVWKIFADDMAPAYFTSYPNTLLDAKSDIYDLEKVNSIIGPHKSHLLTLYYTHVHPSLPILEDRPSLESSLSAGTIPASLAAAIYCSAVVFWNHSPALRDLPPVPKDPLYDFVFSAVTLEARTPTLRTVQAMLLYMQIPPRIVREPNHPGFWALTGQVSTKYTVQPSSGWLAGISPRIRKAGTGADPCFKLVSLAQDTGLHVDPAGWNTCLSERRMRRILWWAVYMHDKWLAHWLGRPSHIDDRQFSVAPLEVADFAVDASPASEYLCRSVEAFVMLSKLTRVLSSVLDNFYTITRTSCMMPPEEALSRASNCQAQLGECLSEQGSVLLRPSRVINDYAFVFAYYGIAVSIQRALFACVGGTSYYDIARETLLFEDLSNVFEDLLKRESLDGLWLSYCKSNIAVIGSFMITALLSSTDNSVYQARREALEGFRVQLCRLAERFEFAALPLLRMNLLLERFSESGGTTDEQDE